MNLDTVFAWLGIIIAVLFVPYIIVSIRYGGPFCGIPHLLWPLEVIDELEKKINSVIKRA